MNESEQLTETPDSTTAPVDVRAEILATIGRKLSEARHARKEQLEDVVRTLKLQRPHLQALESGDWQGLPDEVYALGFLRQYSQYLNIDVSNEIEQLKEEQYRLTKPLTFPDPPVAPSRRWAWIAGLGFIALFILFNIFDQFGNSDHTNAPEEDQFAQTVEESLPTPTESPIPDSEATDDAPAASEQPGEPQAAAESTAAQPAPQAPTETAPVINNQAAEPAAKAATSNTKHPARMHSYRFQAVGDAVWFQAYLPDAQGNKGKLAREALLPDGKYAIIRAEADQLWITCGNAPALSISVDGKPLVEAGNLGSGKKVLRDYRLERE